MLSSRGGLKVQEVLPDSPAAEAGLKEGDILKMVDGAPVFNLMDVHKAFSNKGAHELILHRDNHDLSVTVTLPP